MTVMALKSKPNCRMAEGIQPYPPLIEGKQTDAAPK